ncbi:hypothetical protein SUGI_0594400 [Cryptomeria japonica]|uniref:uncharacterized protein LOC131074821 n=1 Tax=Cryptomeria japonica TaxID=3369 RepID=UPI0024147AC9|nr:uncharacterized protein LOC131074821 [Cryptomeria japonica]GLJ30058.1 hypothetical protein SUGI_0594400 [Cryptomeria japonica]
MATEKEEVTIVSRLAKKKFGSFLEDGNTRIYALEMPHRHTWSKFNMEITPFVNVLASFMHEINEGKKMEREYLAQLAAHGAVPVNNGKTMIWMEGPLGWIAWMDQ